MFHGDIAYALKPDKFWSYISVAGDKDEGDHPIRKRSGLVGVSWSEGYLKLVEGHKWNEVLSQQIKK